MSYLFRAGSSVIVFTCVVVLYCPPIYLKRFGTEGWEAGRRERGKKGGNEIRMNKLQWCGAAD